MQKLRTNMKEKKYEVTLAGRAEEMLLARTEFLARVSLSAAHMLISEFRDVESKLIEDPYMFPYADELDVPGIPLETYKKCIFYKRYKAIFLIDENNVFIDAIIDCRQENNNLYM